MENQLKQNNMLPIVLAWERVKEVKRVLPACFAIALFLTSCTWQVTPIQIPTPTLVPIDLAGPEMKVGLTYSYVNDTLLVAVPAGEFTMGYGGADNPVHQIWLKDYWVFRNKVTNKPYSA